jgi:hypothetical protein
MGRGRPPLNYEIKREKKGEKTTRESKKEKRRRRKKMELFNSGVVIGP